MITTKYNWKQWLHKTYPDVTAVPIYGLNAYILSKPLEPVHMFEYNIQTLKNGQYVVFVGTPVSEIPALLKKLNTEGIQGTRPHNEGLCNPTTFSSFEKWLNRHDIKYKYRTYSGNTTANTLLGSAKEDPAWNRHGNWYIYEFAQDTVEESKINPVTPYLKTENNTVVLLIKAPAQIYVSKRQRFLKHFELMQPIYEQLVVALSKDDTETATSLVNQYASMQFDRTMVLNSYDDMKEAYNEGILTLFVKNIANFTAQEDDTIL